MKGETELEVLRRDKRILKAILEKKHLEKENLMIRQEIVELDEVTEAERGRTFSTPASLAHHKREDGEGG
jgi:hypothetical protein